MFSENFNEDAKDLIKKLLVSEPKDRIGAFNLSEIKAHPFFKDINFETIRTSTFPFRPTRIMDSFEHQSE